MPILLWPESLVTTDGGMVLIPIPDLAKKLATPDTRGEVLLLSHNLAAVFFHLSWSTNRIILDGMTVCEIVMMKNDMGCPNLQQQIPSPHSNLGFPAENHTGIQEFNFRRQYKTRK